MKREPNLELLESMLEDSKYGAQFTLDEIGLAMGISRERVRQIEDMALRKLRRAISSVADLKNSLHDYRNLKNFANNK